MFNIVCLEKGVVIAHKPTINSNLYILVLQEITKKAKKTKKKSIKEINVKQKQQKQEVKPKKKHWNNHEKPTNTTLYQTKMCYCIVLYILHIVLYCVLCCIVYCILYIVYMYIYIVDALYTVLYCTLHYFTLHYTGLRGWFSEEYKLDLEINVFCLWYGFNNVLCW